MIINVNIIIQSNTPRKKFRGIYNVFLFNLGKKNELALILKLITYRKTPIFTFKKRTITRKKETNSKSKLFQSFCEYK